MGAEKEILRLVVDSNVIFSALIRGSKSAALKILYGENIEFFAPEEALEEFKKYAAALEGKSKEDFQELMLLVFSEVKIIPANYYSRHMRDAFAAVRNIDEKDSPFIALSMALNCPLWSDDKKLRAQGRVEIISTHELIHRFSKSLK